MSSAWISTLEQLEPNYHRYQKMLEDGPKVRAILEHKNFRWRVKVEEDWGDSSIGHMYYTATYTNRDVCVDWTAEQLSKHRFVNRISFDQWAFLRKRNAEKFITLFNLRWAR
jgi:hypothetical protein